MTGQDVVAHYAHPSIPGTVSHQYTDNEGRAEFFSEHTAEPLHVELFVHGESCGPYAVEEGARYTVELSRK